MFDYCKMAGNIWGDVLENMSSESENSDVSEAVDDDTYALINMHEHANIKFPNEFQTMLIIFPRQSSYYKLTCR